MNILFLMKVFGIGGQEKVTQILAESFVHHGHKVTIASFATPFGLIVENMDPRVKVVDLHSVFDVNDEVISRVRSLLIDNRINVVINQWGLPFVPTKVLKKTCKGLNVKTIAIYHNDPETNARIKDVEIALENCKNPIKQAFLISKKKVFRVITSNSMRYVYNNSNQYQVLSPSYIESFKRFTGIENANHLISLTNPVTIDNSGYTYSFEQKQKEIIYCGRIDYNQKRVYRLIDAWRLVEKDFPDWNLTIVGDGVSRKEVEQQVKDCGLQHVQFEGFQLPVAYYKRASILALTSEYEGFPLVLAECMSFGVVPVVYGSFSAVYDIIKDSENGCIVPKINGLFSTEAMADCLRNLMKDENKRRRMAQAAIETSKYYSIENIYKQWEKVLEELT